VGNSPHLRDLERRDVLGAVRWVRMKHAKAQSLNIYGPGRKASGRAALSERRRFLSPEDAIEARRRRRPYYGLSTMQDNWLIKSTSDGRFWIATHFWRLPVALGRNSSRVWHGVSADNRLRPNRPRPCSSAPFTRPPDPTSVPLLPRQRSCFDIDSFEARNCASRPSQLEICIRIRKADTRQCCCG